MPYMGKARHSLSHYRLCTFDMGKLIPVACIEVLMGDVFVHTTSCLLRIATLVSPVMHPVDVRIHHWYVPNRIIMPTWDEFITGRSPSEIIPQFGAVDVTQGDVLDHMGIPPGTNAAQGLSKLPVRAYNKVYNEFYRDQDLIAERSEDTTTLATIGWAKDYFTTARSDPQQGDGITIPFTGKSDVIFDTQFTAGVTAGGKAVHATLAASTDSLANIKTTLANDGTPDAGQLRVDLGSNTSTANIDVNDFRMAMAMQRHLEARNRWGSRIQDYLAYHGIRPRDGRLDIPEYCGGGKQTVAFSEVLATAEGTNTAVGDQAGHGISSIRTRRYGRFFPESGWLLSLLSVRPRTIYADQVHRQWLRAVKDDFWQKEYEAFGPQAVVVKEVYGPHTNETDVFGYQGRHDEYRHHPSYVSGGFRTTDDHWHMARFFSSAPALNQAFVECAPTDRIYADTAEPECRAMVSHRIDSRRLVSKRSRY